MTRWSVGHSGNLRIRNWDNEELHVVFDVTSGDTHLLDDLSLQLLHLISAQASTTSTLTDAVADHFAEGERREMEEFVDATLLHLQDSGLASRVDN